MKRVFLCTGIAAALLTACSQTEDELMQPAQQEIALSVVNQAITKTPVTGISFPNIPIYVSAWNSVSKDYFKNIEFGKSGDTWKAGQLWPINGVTSFLAYAFNPDATTQGSPAVIDKDKADWGTGTADPKTNWAKQVVFDLSSKSLCYAPVTANGNAVSTADKATPYVDLLYANADQTKEKDYATVNMEFKHSGAWIVFNVKLGTDISSSATLTVNNFWLSNIYKGGKLTIDNSSYAGAKASWDFSSTSLTKEDYAVESFPQATTDMTKGLALSTTDQTFGVIIPEQAQTAIKFKYTLSSTGTAFDDQTATYEYPLSRFDKWEMGKKYVYNITISFSEITINPSVTNWDDVSKDVAIQ